MTEKDVTINVLPAARARAGVFTATAEGWVLVHFAGITRKVSAGWLLSTKNAQAEANEPERGELPTLQSRMRCILEYTAKR